MTERNQRPAISTVKSRTPPGRYRPGDQPRPWKPALEDREDHQRPAINAVKLAHHHTEVEVLTTRLRCPRPPDTMRPPAMDVTGGLIVSFSANRQSRSVSFVLRLSPAVLRSSAPSSDMMRRPRS